MHLRAFAREFEAPASRSSASDLYRHDGEDALRIVGLLGAGGSSQVWHALDSSGRSIALKTLLPDLARRRGAVDWLLREHELLVELRHPQVVATLGVVEFQGAPALAMEYLGGGDLVPLARDGPEAVGGCGARRARCARARALPRLRAPRSKGAQRAVRRAESRAARRFRASLALRIGAAARRHDGAPTGRPARATCTVDRGEDVYAFAVLLHELIFGRLPAQDAAPNRPLTALDEAVAPRLVALRDLVVETLDLGTTQVAGSLPAFADVLESVAAGG